jgi:hypothetical protein
MQSSQYFLPGPRTSRLRGWESSCREVKGNAERSFFALTEACGGYGFGTQIAVICVARRGWEDSGEVGVWRIEG